MPPTIWNTREVWNASTDPDRMLDAVAGRLSDRKLLLFICECARRVGGLLPPGVPNLIPRVEAAAEVNGDEERDAVLREALDRSLAGGADWVSVLVRRPKWVHGLVQFAAGLLRNLEWRAVVPAAELAATEYLAPSLNTSPRRDHPEQAALLRCVAGYPFLPAALDPAWRTSDVVSLAAGIYAERAFDRLPILADALMDAGCCADNFQSHLRSPGPHVRGCWVVDLILGKS
jgi:hypothetical protein